MYAKCDVVTDLTDGRTLRMNHANNPKVTLDQVRAYLKTCVSHGGALKYNGAARADAVEKVRGFLKQYFKITG